MQLSELDELSLVQMAQAGDRPALGELLKRHGPMLYRAVLLPRLGDVALAKEALSETYTRIIEHFDRFVWQAKGVYPYFRVIALRIALDILRSRKRQILFQPEDLEREIDASERDERVALDAVVLERQDLEAARRKVERALAELNPRYREAIVMRVLEERSREETAFKLGVSVATLDVILHRALSALKKVLGPGRGDVRERGVEP